MKYAMLVAVLATLAMMTSTSAATSTCPPTKSIKQTLVKTGGFTYEALPAEGLVWRGKNPLATASYLADSTFHDVRYDARSKTITCTYKGPMGNDASLSVSLKHVKGWNLKPTGYWRGTYCEDPDLFECAFSHQ